MASILDEKRPVLFSGGTKYLENLTETLTAKQLI